MDLSNFEFVLPLYHESWDKLWLPKKFAEVLDGQEPRQLKLWEASGGRRRWDVDVHFDGEGRMYLVHGWEQFASERGLQAGHFLGFVYDRDNVLTVKVFDGTLCRRQYHIDDEEDAPPQQLHRVYINILDGDE